MGPADLRKKRKRGCAGNKNGVWRRKGGCGGGEKNGVWRLCGRRERRRMKAVWEKTSGRRGRLLTRT